ncbi:MAG: bifunctional oligoribonuclease/PAP phosphatase NrnA [Arcobacteraceae bacterium]
MKNSELLKQMYQEIQNAHYILLVTHKNPDADTLSSALSLSNFLYENRFKHKVFNISDLLPRRLDFLNKFDKITNEIPKFYDLVIYLDCADMYRVGKEFDHEIKSISIDHHQSNTNFADINIVDDTKGSTAELLYSFYEVNNLNISKHNAECLYVGIYDDSIAFTTPRTNEETFRVITTLMKAKIDVSHISQKLLKRESLARFRMIPRIMNSLELHKEGKLATVCVQQEWIKETGVLVHECDDIVDMVLNIGIVEVVAYFRVIDNKVRVSLRSKNDIDVSVIASQFNGGGHKNAAGLSINTNKLTIAKEEVLKTTLDYI